MRSKEDLPPDDAARLVFEKKINRLNDSVLQEKLELAADPCLGFLGFYEDLPAKPAKKRESGFWEKNKRIHLAMP